MANNPFNLFGVPPLAPQPAAVNQLPPLFGAQPPVIQPPFQPGQPGFNLFNLPAPAAAAAGAVQLPPVFGVQPVFNLFGVQPPVVIQQLPRAAVQQAADNEEDDEEDDDDLEAKALEYRKRALQAKGIDISKLDLKSNKDNKELVPNFIKGPVAIAPTEEQIKIDDLRKKYGDFFVVMTSCNDTYVGKLSPIELAAIPPFNFVLKVVPRDSIAKYVTEPLTLPLTAADTKTLSVKSVDTKDVKTPAPSKTSLSLDDLEVSTTQDKSKILVSYITSMDGLAYRSTFLANNNPIANYAESLYVPYKIEQMRMVFGKTMVALRDSYLLTAKLIQSPVVNNTQYDDITHNKYFATNVKQLYQKLQTESKGLDDNGRLDLYNKIIAAQSRYKLVTPKAEDSVLDYYAAQIIRDKIPGEYQYVGQYFLLHPGLIEYSRVIMNELLTRSLWQKKYFKYVRPLLKIESFRVANTPEVDGKSVDIPKNYFTIFTYQEIKDFYLIASGQIGDPIANISAFTGELSQLLDYSKTCLTGSAICYALTITNSRLLRYLMYQANNQLEQQYNAVVTDRKIDLANKTLDTERGIVLDDNKRPVALFEFGADIDLAILTTDTKEFDAIAIQHFGVIAAMYPQIKLEKRTRTTGYTYQIYSTDGTTYTEGFRNVEIYMGTIAKILSHHVPMVRGWYDGQLHLDVTAVEQFSGERNYTTYDNYFYFASSKASPAEIMFKYYNRGFTYSPASRDSQGYITQRLFNDVITIVKQQKTTEWQRKRVVYQIPL